jgi:hypothetical protein
MCNVRSKIQHNLLRKAQTDRDLLRIMWAKCDILNSISFSKTSQNVDYIFQYVHWTQAKTMDIQRCPRIKEDTPTRQ